MITADDVKRFLRGELTDPVRAAEILLAAESDPELSLWLDLFVPIVEPESDPRPDSSAVAQPKSPHWPRT